MNWDQAPTLEWLSFDDRPSAQDLTDRSGRRWKPRAILALGREGFVQRFDGHTRFAIALFGAVAREAAQEEAARLSPADRAAFHAVDQEWARLTDAALTLLYTLDDLIGGTALLGDAMELAADREEALRRSALFWNVPVAGAWARWARTRRTLDIVLDPRRTMRAREWRVFRASERAVVRRESRRLLAAFGDLEERRLGGYVRAACADHVRAMALRIDRRG